MFQVLVALVVLRRRLALRSLRVVCWARYAPGSQGMPVKREHFEQTVGQYFKDNEDVAAWASENGVALP